jgi:hypothetical protein
MVTGFYSPTDDPEVFESTALTVGPWSPDAQHAGPPAALLVRALERLAPTTAGPATLVRVGFDILGPVPVAPLRVRARTLRPGRAVELVEATLLAGSRPVVRATGWRIRTVSPALPIGTPEGAPPVGPRDAGPAERLSAEGYLSAVEWRSVDGRFDKPGPASAWGHLLVPVVAGEEPSGWQRTVALADSGNGLSGELDLADWLYINTELTVHVFREPVDDWIFLAARSRLDPAGVGLAETELSDTAGRFGRGAQALLVAPR